MSLLSVLSYSLQRTYLWLLYCTSTDSSVLWTFQGQMSDFLHFRKEIVMYFKVWWAACCCVRIRAVICNNTTSHFLRRGGAGSLLHPTHRQGTSDYKHAWQWGSYQSLSSTGNANQAWDAQVRLKLLVEEWQCSLTGSEWGVVCHHSGIDVCCTSAWRNYLVSGKGIFQSLLMYAQVAKWWKILRVFLLLESSYPIWSSHLVC